MSRQSEDVYVKAKSRLPDCPIISGLVCCFPICVPLTCFGMHMKKKGQKPFDAAKLAQEGGKYLTNADGRTIEYFVYGSTAKTAKVLVNMHGSGFSAKAENDFYGPICEKLGVKGIAVSWVGHGYTDMQIGRQVKDWPKTDLAPVLAAEGVDKFMITGHSSGNPHAMAAAWYFPERCVGLGLNAPCLPAETCKKFGLTGALGSDSLPITSDLLKGHNSWFFPLMGLTMALPQSVLLSGLAKDTPKLKSDPKLVQWILDNMRRGSVRGTIATAGWESAFDVCYEWGFDPCDIDTKNVCVWHAADDPLCPVDNGRWLAEMFRAKKGVKVDFRDDAIGFGHFTWNQGEFAQPNTSLVQKLLSQM